VNGAEETNIATTIASETMRLQFDLIFENSFVFVDILIVKILKYNRTCTKKASQQVTRFS